MFALDLHDEVLFGPGLLDFVMLDLPVLSQRLGLPRLQAHEKVTRTQGKRIFCSFISLEFVGECEIPAPVEHPGRIYRSLALTLDLGLGRRSFASRARDCFCPQCIILNTQ